MIKESWVITFVDRVNMIVYSVDVLSRLVNEPTCPEDEVIAIEYVIKDWSGSWDNNPPDRTYVEIFRATVDLEAVRKGRS